MTIDPVYFWLAILMVTLILVGIRAQGQLQKAARREHRLRHFVREQSTTIRTMARDTLRLRRHSLTLLTEIEQISAECANLRNEIAEAERIDRRLYVLDDRRTLDDQAWLVTIAHPNYKGHASPKATPRLNMEWMTGRRYIVWAIDKDRALDKINARLPKEKGYVIQQLTPYTDRP